MGECVKVRLKEVKEEHDETSSCASSWSSSPNTSVARSNSDWGQQFIAKGLPPIVQISPIRLCRRWDKHHHCRQTDTHTHVKDTDRKRMKRNSKRNRNKTIYWPSNLRILFIFMVLNKFELARVQPCGKRRTSGCQYSLNKLRMQLLEGQSCLNMLPK